MYSKEIKFEVEFLPEAIEFLETVEIKTRDKIYYNIKKSQSINDNELLKEVNEFIWEFRTLYNGKAYRLFAFWDKKTQIKRWLLQHMGF